MAKLKKKTVTYYEFYCPGCKHLHVYVVADDNSQWQFNGNLESPSFTPSLLNRIPFLNPVTNVMEYRESCHLFVTNGKIEYCASGTDHELAGQTIELPEH